MDKYFLESVALQGYVKHGLDPSQPTSPLKIARLELGEDAIIRPPAMMGAPAALIRVEGRWLIAIKKAVPMTYARFFAGHELAHYWFDAMGYNEDDLEVCCDYVAAALIAPKPAILSLQRSFGFALPDIANAAGSTQTWAALRVAEVLDMPLAVIAPKIRVRGPDEWVWPEERVLRAWGKSPPPGLAKTKLTDDPRRIVLVGDEVAS